MNSYQKLKAENRRLKKEIYLILFKPDAYETTEIKFSYSLLKQIEEAVMAGSPINGHSNFVFAGLDIPKDSYFAQDKPLDEFLKQKK